MTEFNDDILVFDNGGESMDRYTVFPYWNNFDIRVAAQYLGLAPGGRGVSMWGEINLSDVPGLQLDESNWLGKRIPFASLDEETRNHILARIKD